MPLRQLGKLGVGRLPSSVAVGRAQLEEVCASPQGANWSGQATAPCPAHFCPEAPQQTHQDRKERPLFTMSVFGFGIVQKWQLWVS